MVAVWIIFILLLVLSVVLLTGHGSFLIAGYNTSSQEEKEKYNAKKLCRTTGVSLLLILFATAGLFIIPLESIYRTPYFIFYFIFMIADIGFTMYFTNTHCYRRGYEKQKDDEKNKKQTLFIIAGISIVLSPVLLLVSITLYQASLPPVFTIAGDSLKISSSNGETIPLKGIKNIKLEESLPYELTKENGSDLGSILKGRFRAGTETAHVYIDASRPPFIIIETEEGLHVLNDQTRGKTEALYKQLVSIRQE
ncbi:DUF3784 domain-containing protein [Clostridium boliviensis]|uniref:DUF3784 domain-containing protein n=1 Tax=Clostridium boliviensis TaxID=318465 RepID=A0ABU4GI77_9CLOT|nr:DUF3784 domain-containing protein [Clostridium boliviensis]MDW2797315.1 DUF3784 domain-containing protein [Clostridium boliviensis]